MDGKLNVVSSSPVLSPTPNLIFLFINRVEGWGKWQQMLQFPVQKRLRNPREPSVEVNLQTIERRSHPAPVSNHRPLALRAVYQTTLISLMPSIALPLHKPAIYSKGISVSQVLWHYFCSCGISHKINLFQGSKCTLQKKCLTESLHCLLKEPFSFFLHFCSVPAHQEQQQ